MHTVGVIGGGQLAWMMADAAQKLGMQLAVQTPKQTDPAVRIAHKVVLAEIEDAIGTQELAKFSDVITFENEFVDRLALQSLAAGGIPFYPSLDAIAPLLDKFDQRSYLQALGLPTPKFLVLPPDADGALLTQLGFPVVLKARRHGYDGYGTFICSSPTQLAEILQTAALKTQHAARKPEWLLEEYIPFDRELAVMAARSIQGEISIYPVVETQQKQQVCHRVIVMPQISSAITAQVETIARTLLDRLNYVGIMGIEFFLTRDGRVLVNETAPRTHNSGHYSLDACETSQFEQQLRAICGLPLGSPALTCAGAVMVNLLGFETAESDYLEQRQQLAQLPNAQVYWYGKSLARPGRKLGHVTVLLSDPVSDSVAAPVIHQDCQPPILEEPMSLVGSDALESAALKIAQQIEAIWQPHGDR